MREEDYRGSGGVRIHYRSWHPEGRRGRWSDLPRGELARRPARLDRRAACGDAASPSPRWTCAAAASRRASASTSTTRRLCRRLRRADRDRQGAPPGPAGLPARPQRRGRHLVTYALDHQDEIDGLICESFAFQVPAPVRADGDQGSQPPAPKLGVLTLHMKDFTRDPVALAALEADPLTKDESQPAATVAALVRADERLHDFFAQITLPVLILHGTDDKATLPGKRVLLRACRIDGQDAEALRRALSRPAQRPRQGGGHGRRPAWIEARLPAWVCMLRRGRARGRSGRPRS